MAKMERKWLQMLIEEFEKPYMKRLQEFLAQEKGAGKVIYPPDELIFNAFCQTPFDKVKVVILGQDPYHGKGQAHGLSFSVPPGVKTPPSLQNIYKEIHDDLGCPIPDHGCLISWARQGVLLLNATLTVEAGRPLSHHGKGWERFTDRAVEILYERKDPIAFLLWGKSAQEKCKNVFREHESEARGHHLILKAAHPSFYSAANFFGCRHFSKTNEFLSKSGKDPIDWKIK